MLGEPEMSARGLLSLAVVERAAVGLGVCVRPLAFRVYDADSGETKVVEVACGALVAAKCPSCAQAARKMRAAQCREGWHLEAEPEGRPKRRKSAEEEAETVNRRRVRSTRRRQDTPELPRREKREGTLGQTYTGRDGRVYRPSMFVTLTLPSYGRVKDGAPVDPRSYDYTGAARDAMHFGRLVDRFVQNLRRVAGYAAQYFATVEPQRRLAPHLHMAIRGTLPRRELRQIVAATYHQVWWPADTGRVLVGEHLPVWCEGVGYLDPATGEVLETWEETLDGLDAPRHTLRFGTQMNVRGVLIGSAEADRRVGYLAKYLTKSMADALVSQWGTLSWAERQHVARLIETVTYEPCSAECPNWLRYGIQPKGARSGLVPGKCTRRAHRPERMGYGGRRALVSRNWSGRRLTDYAAERRAWVLQALGEEEAEESGGRHVWEAVKDGDEGLPSRTLRLWRLVRERQAAYAEMEKRRRGDAGRRDGEA
ncbi:replication initiator [Nonomuraea sp. NPDC026600]|uniref:replication initiator n=1 Tax=Nonomuraea sp. NPDC026600 TaxID=3155363 RepID=UPI0033EE0BFE